ncbi:TIGR04388 family protein, partial [Leptospira alexanderi]|uniref:TIGR04388 family protein n=1 Tax=Leptospira alexanderi TaxID=100053 RepID=UPI0011158044
DATNSRDYTLVRKDETITIAAPPMIRFGTDEMAQGGVSPSAIEKVVKLNGNTGIVPASNGNTGIVPPSNRNTGIVPPSNGNTGIVPPSNRNTGIVPPSNGNTGIVPPSSGSSSHGFDLFGSTEAVGSAINSSFGNLNKYFSKSNMEKLSASLFTSANNADARDSDNVSAASQSAQSQSQSAGMVVDLIKSVALGGM